MDHSFGDSRVWNSLVEQCIGGNMAAIKLYYELLEKFGGYTPKFNAQNGNLEQTDGSGVIIIDDIVAAN